MYGAIKTTEPKAAGASIKSQRRKPPPRLSTKRKPQAVFNRVFSEKALSSSESSGRTVHSWLYTMLNPRSNQFPAIFFKTFIGSVIAIDLIFFVVSTEPQFKDNQIFFHAEGITSCIFLVEYLARLWTVTESRYYQNLGPIQGRLKYMVTTNAIVDALATFPFFIELVTGLQLPTLTYLRVFRLLRMFKTQAFARSFDALWRVFFYNRAIMQVAGLLVCFLVLVTSVMLYYLRPPNDAEEFQSIGSTMYIATLLLTGQGGPEDNNFPWYTKAVILMTGVFSVAVFAIPASMLTWGFEAEAARLAAVSRRKIKSGGVSSSASEWESDEDNSTDEEYQKIIAGEEDDELTKDENLKKLLKIFQNADIDQSGSLNAEEFVKHLKENVGTLSSVIGGGRIGKKFAGGGGDELNLRINNLEGKVDAINDKLDQLLAAFMKQE